jgi:hypothetical protein
LELRVIAAEEIASAVAAAVESIITAAAETRAIAAEAMAAAAETRETAAETRMTVLMKRVIVAETRMASAEAREVAVEAKDAALEAAIRQILRARRKDCPTPNCPICMESITADQLNLVCGHFMHLLCFSNMLERGFSTCPLCRVPV